MTSDIKHHYICSFADVVAEVEVEPLNGKVHFILNHLNTLNKFNMSCMSTLFHANMLTLTDSYIFMSLYM